MEDRRDDQADSSGAKNPVVSFLSSNQLNTHPHISFNQRICLVHNGVIENYKELKNFLTEKNYSFYGETYSLWEYFDKSKAVPISDRWTLRQVVRTSIGGEKIRLSCTKSLFRCLFCAFDTSKLLTFS